MMRSYKFQIRPTTRQAQSLAACIEDHRQLYNAALEERREAYRMRRVSISYGSQSAQLKEIRNTDSAGQGRWSFGSQQATLRRLDRSFAAFFRRVKARQTPGYPRFKGRGWFDTVQWPRDRDGCRWDSQPQQPAARVYLQGVGHVKVNQHRPVQGVVKTISVKREGRRWYVILSCDGVPAVPLPPTGREIGIDMGVTHFLTTSAGQHVPNSRYLAGSPRSSPGLGGRWRGASAGRNDAVPWCSGSRRSTGRSGTSAPTRRIRSHSTWCAPPT